MTKLKLQLHSVSMRVEGKYINISQNDKCYYKFIKNFKNKSIVLQLTMHNHIHKHIQR